jgi:uncharacterized membrane protein
MKRSEFMLALKSALDEKNVRETDEIVSEYDEHFDFKLRDGFSEEEISAKLGDPEELAAQFAPGGVSKNYAVSAVITAGLVFADILSVLLAIVAYAMTAVLAAAALSFLGAGLCLGLNLNYLSSAIPHIPYGVALVLALSCVALAILSASAAVYYTSYIAGIIRSYLRFHKNALSSAKGGTPLPPLPVQTRLSLKTRRTLRRFVLSALVFGVFFAAVGYLMAAMSAGSPEFWHIWRWFE